MAQASASARSPSTGTRAIEAVRHFNRFYTKRIAFRRGGLLWSPFSLTEARVLFELRARGETNARDLARDLGLDAGYMSRLLRKLERQTLLTRVRAEDDGRRRILTLTDEGRRIHDELAERAKTEAGEMIGGLSAAETDRLLDAMRTVETVLSEEDAPAEPIVLREHRTGDMGWVLHRHGVLYGESEGWGEEFELDVAQVLVDVFRDYDRARDRSWIAEIGGRIVGSVFLVREEGRTARLRLLYVEPGVRGRGLGRRLVDEVVRFARGVGYGRIVLWTTSNLAAARHLYAEAGFKMTDEKPEHRWGCDVTSETWELEIERRP